VSWDELGEAVRRRDEDALLFSPPDALRRVGNLGDLFAPVQELEQRLPVVVKS
jgi:hypothetical protein